MTNKIIRSRIADGKKSYNLYEIETDDHLIKWYYIRIYSSEIRRWVKSCNPVLWKKASNMTAVDIAIKEELYTMFSLKWEV